MKNLLKRLFRTSVFSLIFFFSVFLGSVFAEDEITVDWSDDVFTSLDDMDVENNVVLFVGDECDACDALVLSIQDFELDKYFDIQLVDGHDNDVKGYLTGHLETEGFDTDPLYIPVLVHQDFTTQGYLSCAAYLQSLDRLKENEDWLDSVKEVATEIYNEEKAEVDSQSLLELIPKLDWWVFVAVGVGFVALVVVLIIFLRKRKSLGRRGQVLVTVGQIVFSALLVVFLVLMANSKKQYVPDVSLAGCVETGNNIWACDTYAELSAKRAQQDEEAGLYNSDYIKTAEKIFDGDGWKTSIGDTIGDSQTSESQVLRDAYNDVVDALESRSKAETFTNTNFDNYCNDKISEQEITDCHKSNLDSCDSTDSPGECRKAYESYLSVSRPAEYMVQRYLMTVEQDKQERLGECNKLSDSVLIDACRTQVEDKFNSYNKPTDYDSVMSAIDEYEADNGLYNLTIDPITKTIIRTPKNISVIDGYCEATAYIEGSGSTSGTITCRCDNGIGGYAYTTVYESSTSCDVVCRVRFPCPGCNPPEPGPPDPPDNPDEPYCGDGILGNTDNEECEYGDPDGVTCSWNTCNADCSCAEITEAYCGDGIFGNTEGEECEIGDPDGVTCAWDSCNHVICKCIEPGCGDGVLDEGEQCERDDPDGFTCLWDTECSQQTCTCPEEPSPSCGDGTLDEGEQCESGDPEGVTCEWDKCSKVSCTCPGESQPQTSLFESTQARIIAGFSLMVLGFFLTPFTKMLSNYYMKISDGMLKIGKKNFEDRVLKEKRKK